MKNIFQKIADLQACSEALGVALQAFMSAIFQQRKHEIMIIVVPGRVPGPKHFTDSSYSEFLDHRI